MKFNDKHCYNSRFGKELVFEHGARLGKILKFDRSP